MPSNARMRTFAGVRANFCHLNSTAGMTCSAPYTGNMNRNTCTKRSGDTSEHPSRQWWIASHGPSGGGYDGGVASAPSHIAMRARRLPGAVF